MRREILFTVALFIFCSGLYAQQTGNDLLHGSKAIIKMDNNEELDATESSNAVFWLGYINGYTESKIFQELYCGKKGPYCFPLKGIENQQIARIIVKYLEENPEQLHESARVLLSGALIKYFPCVQSK